MHSGACFDSLCPRSDYAPHVAPSTVLISGASVAGPVLAYWLHRFGFQPTVVERTAELRFGGGGHAVDLFGPAVQIIEWMGTLPQVRDARTRTEIISTCEKAIARSTYRRS